jgi:hypothetical protein
VLLLLAAIRLSATAAANITANITANCEGSCRNRNAVHPRSGREVYRSYCTNADDLPRSTTSKHMKCSTSDF